MTFQIRQLDHSEHHLIPDLYQRTYARERSVSHQQWLDINPLGRPRYWGAFKEQQLIGLTGLLPWVRGRDDQTQVWNLGEVMVDQACRGQSVFRKLLDGLFTDLRQEGFDEEVYTLPNPASAPALKKRVELSQHTQVPRQVFFLDVKATPLKKLGPLATWFSFLMPALPAASDAWERSSEEDLRFQGHNQDFLNWRFLDAPQSWSCWQEEGDQACWRMESNAIQIGLWPKEMSPRHRFLSFLIAVAKEKKIGKIEWAGQPDDLMKEKLRSWGMTDRCFGKKTWRNELYRTDNAWPLIDRLHFDT